MLLALKDLEAEGLHFDVSYQRQPFFLRGSQDNINRWMDEIGLPHDAPRGQVLQKMGWDKGGIWDLFEQAGLDRDVEVCNTGQYSDTMNSHRLAWHAASISNEKGELMWKALSRRYFQGKDTAIRPIRLDSRPMLLECAEEVGLDLTECQRVLDSDMYRKDIVDCVQQMHAAGINSIPVLIFEIHGLAKGSWMQDPRVCSRAAEVDPQRLARIASETSYFGREIHHGSGNMESFRSILLRLRNAFTASL